jgi:predicted DNA-binding transcriptional regulator AlpA
MQPRLLALALRPFVCGEEVGKVKQYLRVLDVAAMLHVCRATIYNYLKKIPGFPQPMKVGRLSLWDSEEIELFMENAPRGVSGGSP